MADRDFVTREEFDAVRAMAQKAREENAALEARIACAGGGAGEEEGPRSLSVTSYFSLRREDEVAQGAVRPGAAGTAAEAPHPASAASTSDTSP